MLNRKLHRQYLFKILLDIYSTNAGNWLGFKGGTMLYFFYELDRFSVDLDFDLLNEEKTDLVYDSIKQVLYNYGQIKESRDKHYTIFFLLRYKENERGLKVEISKRSRPENRYETKNFYGTDVLALNIEDSFAHKLIAATDRKSIANRDFYDIHFLMKKGYSFNEEIIRKYTGKEPLDYIKYLRSFAEKNIIGERVLDGLGELIDENKKQQVKGDLKQDLLAQLDFWIDERRK